MPSSLSLAVQLYAERCYPAQATLRRLPENQDSRRLLRRRYRRRTVHTTQKESLLWRYYDAPAKCGGVLVGPQREILAEKVRTRLLSLRQLHWAFSRFGLKEPNRG
jgi:hypothetical protein